MTCHLSTSLTGPYTCPPRCTSVHRIAHIRTCTYKCIYDIYIHPCKHAYIHTYMQACIHTYIHTGIQAYRHLTRMQCNVTHAFLPSFIPSSIHMISPQIHVDFPRELPWHFGSRWTPSDSGDFGDLTGDPRILLGSC